MNSKCFIEGEYCFDFVNSIAAFKADEPTYCGLLGVDFIVELSDKFLFVEVKNIDNTKTSNEERKKWMEQLKTQKNSPFLFEMGVKFKDTILRNWANENYFNKPIWYIVLLQFNRINAATRVWFTEQLSGYLPTCFNKRNGFTKVVQIKKRAVLNINEWHKAYPEFSITAII